MQAWGRRCGTGTVLMCQPSQLGSGNGGRGGQRAAGTCRPLILHIISHLMNRDSWDSPQPTLTGVMLGSAASLIHGSSREERVRPSGGRHSVERCHWLTPRLRDQGRVHLIYQLYCRVAYLPARDQVGLLALEIECVTAACSQWCPAFLKGQLRNG